MPRPFEFAAIISLSTLLAVVSALAGALWARGRSSRTRDSRERLIQEVLDRLTASPPPSSNVVLSGPPAPDRRTTVAVPIPPGGPLRTRQDRAIRRGEGAPAPKLIAVPGLNAPAADPIESSAEMGRRFGALWELAESGASAVAIAKETGQPIGQIELILGLRRRARGAENQE